MADWIELPPAAHASLLRALESARRISHRGDYFLWLQGHFNALLPHGVMLAVQLNQQGVVLSQDCLQAVVLDDERLQKLRNATGGLIARLAQWGESQRLVQLTLREADAVPDPAQGAVFNSPGDSRGDAPVQDASALAAAVPAALAQEWGQLDEGLAEMLWVPDVTPGQYLCLAFLALPAPLAAWQKNLLNLMGPQLMVGYLRSLAHEAQQAQHPATGVAELDDLTERQLEILHWVKMGKTNGEIAQIVGISDLTVKNHLQKVFRRLNVHNRAQAVALLVSQRKV